MSTIHIAYFVLFVAAIGVAVVAAAAVAACRRGALDSGTRQMVLGDIRHAPPMPGVARLSDDVQALFEINTETEARVRARASRIDASIARIEEARARLLGDAKQSELGPSRASLPTFRVLVIGPMRHQADHVRRRLHAAPFDTSSIAVEFSETWRPSCAHRRVDLVVLAKFAATHAAYYSALRTYGRARVVRHGGGWNSLALLISRRAQSPRDHVKAA